MNLNDPDRARDELERARARGNPEQIVQTVLFHIWPLYSSHATLLVAAIEELPNAALERHPLLRMLHRMTPVLSRTTRPFKPLVFADDTKGLSPEEIDLLTLIQMIAFRTSGDVEAALTYARRLEDRMTQTRAEFRERTDGPLWYLYHQIGATYLAGGDSVQALLVLATSRQLGSYSLQPDAERLALGRIALAHAFRGSIDDAEVALTAVHDQPPPTAAHIASCRTTEAVAAALIGADRLADDLDDLLALLPPYDSFELTWPYALLARARVALARHDIDEALETIRLTGSAHPVQPGSFAADVIASTSIEALIMADDAERAGRVVTDPREAGMLTRIALLRLAVHRGDQDAASRELAELLRDRSLGPAQRTEVLLLGAWHALAQSGELDEDSAGLILRIGSNPQSRRVLATMPRQLIDGARQRAGQPPTEEFESTVLGLAHGELRPRPQLTKSELRVLRALLLQPTTAEMAAELHLSPNTIKSHLKSLYRKLGVATRDDAVTTAIRLRLIAAPPVGGVRGRL